MAASLLVGGFLAHRHTPEVTLVRYTMVSLFLLGMFFALVGALLLPWFLRLGIGDARAGDCFLAFNAGVLSGLLAWRPRLVSNWAGVRSAFASSGALAAIALVALAILPGKWFLLPPLLGLGLSAGILVRAVSRLSLVLLNPAGSSTFLNLAGLALGAGSVTICILVWVSLDHLGALLGGLAVLPGLFGMSALRSRALRYADGGAVRFGMNWREMLHPAAFLLGWALWFQAASHWTLAGWLSLYLTRQWGASAGAAIGTLALYWFAHTSARLVGSRLPPLGDRARSIFIASAASLIGGAFLLRTAGHSGVIAGTLLLGAGTGVLYTITLSLFAKRYPVFHPDFVRANMALYFVGGLLAPWVTGRLAESFGIDVVIWSALGASAIVLLLLSVLFVETRLTSQTMALE